MNDRSLFAPAPRRQCGLILTIAGSLLFHGSLVGVAALWATHPAPPTPIITTQISDDPLAPIDPQLPAAPPSDPQPAAPVLKDVEPVDDPPPVVIPDLVDMALATPKPHAVTRVTPTRPTATSTVPRASSGRSATAPASVNAVGAGRAGVRWNVFRPAYPSALRLAHVQGSGSIRVSTDGSGRVVNAVIVRSTGSTALDEHTCETAKLQWSGPPNATTTVPITYQLQ